VSAAGSTGVEDDHAKQLEWLDVGALEDFEVGRFRPVDFPAGDVWVLRTAGGTFFALLNLCPHRGAPLCMGEVDGTFLPSSPGTYEFGLEHEIIRCPHHAYEWSLETGRSVFTDSRDRVVRHHTKVEDGRVLVSRQRKK
jgi:nitrite reductase (NADH) small subunit